MDSVVEKDAFRVDPGKPGKRRLIRRKGQSKEKRQCWELTNDELEDLYLTLGTYFQNSAEDPTTLFEFSGFNDLKGLASKAKEAYDTHGNLPISLKVHFK